MKRYYRKIEKIGKLKVEFFWNLRKQIRADRADIDMEYCDEERWWWWSGPFKRGRVIMNEFDAIFLCLVRWLFVTTECVT